MTESNSNIDVLSDDGWEELLFWLPKNIDEKMRETGAFTRSRKIKKSTDLLRIALAYPVLRKSLPDLSRWAAEKGIAEETCFHRLLCPWNRIWHWLRWMPQRSHYLDQINGTGCFTWFGYRVNLSTFACQRRGGQIPEKALSIW